MNAFPIRTDADLDRAFARIDELWGAAPGTPEGDELDVLVVLVEDYERKHHPPLPADPIELIKLRLEELGWSQNRLAKKVDCTSGRMSEFLTGQRALTLPVIRQLSEVLDVPIGMLVGTDDDTSSTHRWVRLSRELAAAVTDPSLLVAIHAKPPHRCHSNTFMATEAAA